MGTSSSKGVFTQPLCAMCSFRGEGIITTDMVKCPCGKQISGVFNRCPECALRVGQCSVCNDNFDVIDLHKLQLKLEREKERKKVEYDATVQFMSGLGVNISDKDVQNAHARIETNFTNIISELNSGKRIY
jgi:hypothetical protein